MNIGKVWAQRKHPHKKSITLLGDWLNNITLHVIIAQINKNTSTFLKVQKYLPVISVVLKNVYLYVVFDFVGKSAFIGLIIKIILLKNNYS